MVKALSIPRSCDHMGGQPHIWKYLTSSVEFGEQMLIIPLISGGKSFQHFHFINKRPILRFHLSHEELIKELLMCDSDSIK